MEDIKNILPENILKQIISEVKKNVKLGSKSLTLINIFNNGSINIDTSYDKLIVDKLMKASTPNLSDEQDETDEARIKEFFELFSMLETIMETYDEFRQIVCLVKNSKKTTVMII